MVLFLHTLFVSHGGRFIFNVLYSFYPVMRRMSFVPSVLSQLSYFL